MTAGDLHQIPGAVAGGEPGDPSGHHDALFFPLAEEQDCPAAIEEARP